MSGFMLTKTLPAVALACCLGPAVPAQDSVEKEIEKGWNLPLSGGVVGRVVSDYVWRGFNLSDPVGEGGPEKPNYDLEVSLATDLERWTGHKLGTIGGFIWWEWYSGQHLFTTGANDDNLQEVDYDLHWEFELADLNLGLDPLGATLSVGWISYTFPQLAGSAHKTDEYYLGLAFDDTAWWGLGRALFNLDIKFWHDYDEVNGSWLDVTVSHGLELGRCPLLKDLPVLQDLTVTPSFALGYDLHYADTNTNRLATLVYGAELGCPLPEAFRPASISDLTLSGFLYYSDGRDSSTGTKDTLFGGVALSIAF